MQIIPAAYSDIQTLIELHRKHLLSNLSAGQTKDGFIRVVYNESDFHSIISDNAIVVAKYCDQIIGYYLLGHSSNSQSLEYQKEALQKFFVGNIRLSELRVACGAQAVLEKEFRGKGLTEKMLQLLIQQVCGKYDYLFSSITKHNLNAFKVHKNSGYLIVAEDDTKFFVCLTLNNL
jgi:hypothetical protein